MTRYFGKAFLLSIVLLAAAVVSCIMGYYIIAASLCVVAFFANASEIKQYASMFQFANFRLHTMLLGFSVDLLFHNGTFPYLACMVMLSFAGVLRLELFQVMAFTRFLWGDSLGLVLVYGIYVYAGLQHPSDWRGWVLPLLPILFMTYICINVVRDGFKVEKRSNESFIAELGKKAFDFALPDVSGNVVRLSDFENKNHVLLVFVRGDWCPTCHMMIRIYEKNREKFAEKEVMAIGIGPDKTEVNVKMMERLGWKNMLLSDAEQEVTKKYGIIVFSNNAETNYPEGVPLPASILIDKQGIIRYISRPDKTNEFLDPMHIFPIVERLA
jgi:peroxiredoxin